jgi:hypothetical protein
LFTVSTTVQAQVKGSPHGSSGEGAGRSSGLEETRQGEVTIAEAKTFNLNNHFSFKFFRGSTHFFETPEIPNR